MSGALYISPPPFSDDQPGGTHISVQVFRLDHGDKATVSLRNVGPLTPDMAALPLQAAMVSLADVSHHRRPFTGS